VSLLLDISVWDFEHLMHFGGDVSFANSPLFSGGLAKENGTAI
jgi:hypothetical protein